MSRQEQQRDYEIRIEDVGPFVRGSSRPPSVTFVHDRTQTSVPVVLGGGTVTLKINQEIAEMIVNIWVKSQLSEAGYAPTHSVDGSDKITFELRNVL
jgi:hypothetical protein